MAFQGEINGSTVSLSTTFFNKGEVLQSYPTHNKFYVVPNDREYICSRDQLINYSLFVSGVNNNSTYPRLLFDGANPSYSVPYIEVNHYFIEYKNQTYSLIKKKYMLRLQHGGRDHVTITEGGLPSTIRQEMGHAPGVNMGFQGYYTGTSVYRSMYVQELVHYVSEEVVNTITEANVLISMQPTITQTATKAIRILESVAKREENYGLKRRQAFGRRQ